MKRLIIILALILTAFVPISPALAASVYYVSTSGNDANPGTQAQPWKTIQKAANTISAGDTVYVRGG